MPIQLHSLAGEFVYVWCLKCASMVADIGPAKIIRNDQEDVGTRNARCEGVGAKAGQQREKKYAGKMVHGGRML
jgi:hypothetical protein